MPQVRINRTFLLFIFTFISCRSNNNETDTTNDDDSALECSEYGNDFNSCTAVESLECDQTIEGNTGAIGATSSQDWVQCGPAYFSLTGPQYIYSFIPEIDCEFTVGLISIADRMKLLLLKDMGCGCNTHDCLQYDEPPYPNPGNLSVHGNVEAGEVYYIIVDNDTDTIGVAGAYELVTHCQ